MGLLGKLKGELVDIIEWLDDSRTTLAWRFPRYHNEIKNGAELIVREGQQAVFVYRGTIADRFLPGDYTLVSENLPILSTLQGWKHGFNSPFRSEVYFINTRPVTELRWGTPQPLTIRDPDFGMVQLRANGLCIIKIADPEIFLREIIGTDSEVDLEEITELLRRLVAQAFADLVGGLGLGAIELQSRNAEVAGKLRALVAERVDDEYGLAVADIAITMGLPEEITAAMTAGVARGVETKGYVGNVGDVGRLAQVRAADATLAAAQNEGGGAGSMVGAGVGLALGQQMAGALAQPAAPGGPPPPPSAALFHVDAGGGRTGGPFGIAQLQAGIAAGTFSAATLVWTNGMAAWAPAGSVPALAALFAGPPPLPPTPPTPPPPPSAG
jgi:membrane protease subunit (stomatin/prohibitin family)